MSGIYQQGKNEWTAIRVCTTNTKANVRGVIKERQLLNAKSDSKSGSTNVQCKGGESGGGEED